jgi:predicted nuclease of predicted toxin-antitoxin system
MTRVRLYLDHDVPISLVERLGAYTYDVIATRDVGNEELDDDAQLDYAARHERALFSHNRHHFRRLHREWMHQGREHWGIIVARHMPVDDLETLLVKHLSQVNAGDLQNKLVLLKRPP